MRISFNWLKKHVSLPGSITAEEVAEKLKLSTVEVEGVASQGKDLENIVVGKVISAEKHPQADKLKLCQVDAGEKLQIVCGGSNVREGMLVALAKVGAKVKWHGEGDLIELKPTAIRGVESYGMICGATEIGLAGMFPPKDEKEIVDLTEKVKEKSVGKPLAEALGLNDAIFEIDNKSLSHRPDLWGHYGLAREVAALFGKTLNDYKTKPVKTSKNEIDLKVEVRDAKLCPRYMAVAISGIKIAESPDWMKQSLIAAGLRPINNIVDITNYLMLDLGQPMHAFDAKKLTNIIVRPAGKGEKMTLLDGVKVNLSENDLVIADSEKPLALAGIMGGETSGIDESTATIIYESANFNGAAIRKSSVRLGLRTDSSARFEKSLDPTLCEVALQKAVEFTLEFCQGAKVSSRMIDIADFTVAGGPLEVEKNVFAKKLGVEIPEKDIKNILERLGFEIKDKGKVWLVKIPSWRASKDISIVEDLVEEVARIYGYDNISSSAPLFPMASPEENKIRKLEHLLRTVLVRNLAYDEVYNYSFVSREQKDKFGDDGEYVELDNPISKEKPLLRRSLVPNMLENAAKNIEYFSPVKILEIGKVFWPDLHGARTEEKSNELLPRQDIWLAAVCADKKNEIPFMAVRRVAEAAMSELNLPLTIKKLSAVKPWMHPTRAGEIMIGEKSLGYIYEANPATAKKFGLDVRVGVLEINLDELAVIAADSKIKIYEKLPEFPEVSRDLAFTVDKKLAHEKIEEELSGIDPLIKKIELFDVYEGEHVQKEKKSMAYRLTFAHPEKTLNSAEVDKVMEQVIALLHKKYQAEIRA